MTVEAPERPLLLTSRYEPEAAVRFSKDCDEHVMTVLHDDGLYRHLRFRAPNTSTYWFDIITWPGNLTLNGDMGTWTFAREQDMVPWFLSGSDVNLSYWSEKLRAGAAGGRDGAKEYDERLFKAYLADQVDQQIEGYHLSGRDALRLRRAVQEHFFEDYSTHDLSYRENAVEAVQTWPHRDLLDLSDWYEHEWYGYTTQFVWSCLAIRWGLIQYRLSRGETIPSTNPQGEPSAVRTWTPPPPAVVDLALPPHPDDQEASRG